MRILVRNGEQCVTHSWNIAAVRDTDRDTEAHTPIAVCPVGHRRIDELCVWHDHHDVVVGANNRAARSNVFHLTSDPGDLNPVADGDWSLRENDQTADKITGDVLQTKSDADANRTRKYRQRSQMNPGILQNYEDANHQHDVAYHLSNGVLQGAIEPASGKQAVKKKTLRSGGKPKNCHQQRNQQENLNQTQIDCRKRRGPGQWNSRSIHRRDREKHNHRETQNSSDDRDEICVDFEPAEKAPNDLPL